MAKDHSLLKINEVSNEDALAMHERLFNKFVKKNLSKYEQPTFTGFKSDPFILVLGQVAGDSVINFSNFLAPKNMSMGTMRPPPDKKDIPTGYLNTILTALSIMDKFDIPIIYKPHPCENQDQNSVVNNLINLPMFNNVSIVSDISIHELLPLSKAVVTINSGAGFEALIHLKPVVTLGKADYSASTYECKDIEDIKNSKQFINNPVDELRIKKFLYAYLSRAHKTPTELIKQIIPQ
jgi:capsule polysaccharide export protein KpsC/LpsZ